MSIKLIKNLKFLTILFEISLLILFWLYFYSLYPNELIIHKTGKTPDSFISVNYLFFSCVEYFLIYLFSASVNYYNCYKNIEVIDQNLKNDGIVLTETDRAYLKKILISYNGSFIYSDFIKWIKSDMSKQAAFKILNKYVNYGILKVRKGKSNNKLYEINSSQVPYIMKRIN